MTMAPTIAMKRLSVGKIADIHEAVSHQKVKRELASLPLFDAIKRKKRTITPSSSPASIELDSSFGEATCRDVAGYAAADGTSFDRLCRSWCLLRDDILIPHRADHGQCGPFVALREHIPAVYGEEMILGHRWLRGCQPDSGKYFVRPLLIWRNM